MKNNKMSDKLKEVIGAESQKITRKEAIKKALLA